MARGEARKNRIIFLVFFLILVLVVFGMPHLGLQRPRTPEEARTYLHHFYFACQNFWREEGPDRYCDIRIAQKDPVYGFTKYEDILFEGGGTQEDFRAMVLHQGSGRIFEIDRRGEVREIK